MRAIYLSSVAIIVVFGLLSAELMLAPSAKAAEVDGPKVKWDVSLWGKKRAFTAGVEKLSALVKSKTGGNFNIVLHYAGALSKSR